MESTLNLISILERYQQVRQRSAEITAPLQKEDFVVQPIVDVSPPKWHLGHTTWFFEEFILAKKDDYQRFHPDFAYLFNSYYETVGKRVLRVNRGLITRPSVEEVFEYRSYVDNAMEKLLHEGDFESDWLSLLELGLQHEEQHQELLLYDIKYILGHNPLFPAYISASPKAISGMEVNDLGYYEIPEGTYEIGYQGDSFCYDNEYGCHKQFLHECSVANRLITNGEYLEFMQDGGYKNHNFWLSEAWEWVKTNSITSPHYWHEIEGEWYCYKLTGLEKINLSEPVTHVSHFEAMAYAEWRDMRLPTEFEWEVAASIFGDHEKGVFYEDKNWHPVPQQSSNNQFFGDTWEWTNSAYLPYPYFEKAAGAVGEYNGKFMVNQKVLRGGSVATSKSHVRLTYRNFFHPHLRWMFSGVRLAKHL